MLQEEGTARRDGREGALKLLFGRICCLMGLLLGAGGFVVAILGASVKEKRKPTTKHLPDQPIMKYVHPAD